MKSAVLVLGALAVSRAQQVVWTCTSGWRNFEVFSDGSYQVLVRNQPWFTNGTVAVHAGGSWYGADNGSLKLQGTFQDASSDSFGTFNSFSLTWTAVGGPAAGMPLETSMLCYDSGMLGFRTTWPAGASGTNTSYPNGGYDAPISHFPSFPATGFLGSDVRWLLNGGIWTLFEFFGTGVSGGFNGGDGPSWWLNASYAPATGVGPGAPTSPDTLIFCQLDNFKSSRTQTVADPITPGAPARLVMGTYSTVASVPPGFTLTFGLWHGVGMTATSYEWGAQILSAYNTARLPASRDTLNRQLSYWSDNGATVFQSFWDQHCPTRNCTAYAIPNGTTAESMFTELQLYHQSAGIPFGLYQMDTWWFYQGADRAAGGTLDCADWTPRADLFPHGLPWLTQQNGGLPLLLYSWGFVPPSAGNTMTNWTWETSMDGKEACVAVNETLAFYRMIRDRYLAYNGSSFEEDNMGSWSTAWVSHQLTVDATSNWWYGFATPWCEANIPVQICESLASDLLESVKYPCITSTRDNIDDVPGTHQSNDPNDAFFLSRWKVGFARVLIGALDLSPFFDNVWTVPVQPAGNPWGNAPENYTEMAYALSVLGAGAVGIGDMPYVTNVSLALTACMKDGTLLKPSVPSNYLELIYLPAESNPLNTDVSRLFQAPSFIPDGSSAAASGSGSSRYPAAFAAAAQPGSRWAPTQAPYTTLLAVDVAPLIAIQPAYFSPSLASAATGVAGYAAVPWSPGFAGVAAACADGKAAAACALPLSDSQPLNVFTGIAPYNYTHNFELYSLSPVYSNGYALLGELGKFVRVSPVRFGWVTAGTSSGGQPTLTFAVTGAPSETVDVAVLVPPASPAPSASHSHSDSDSDAVSGTVRHVYVGFSEGVIGRTTQIVTCTGTGASPCTVSPADEPVVRVVEML